MAEKPYPVWGGAEVHNNRKSLRAACSIATQLYSVRHCQFETYSQKYLPNGTEYKYFNYEALDADVQMIS